MNGYELSRQWWNFAATHIGEVTVTHSALYYYLVETWNLLGQPDTFGFPKSQGASVLGINLKTFNKAYEDMVKWKFIIEIQRSTNQWTATIVQINGQVLFTNATANAHAQAILNQLPMQYQRYDESNSQRNGTLIEQYKNNTEQELNNVRGEPQNALFINPVETKKRRKKEKSSAEKERKEFVPISFSELLQIFEEKNENEIRPEFLKAQAEKMYNRCMDNGWKTGKPLKPIIDIKRTVRNWILTAVEYNPSLKNSSITPVQTPHKHLTKAELL